MDIRTALEWGRSRLEHSDTPRLDAEILLCHLLEKPRSYLYTWPDRVLSYDQLSAYRTLIQRRETGEPVAHITGQREFWSLMLKVTVDTLIPRPETELLVEKALQRLPDAPCSLADLGTGTGAIALALASERPDCRVTAVDRSEAALAVARENAGQHGLRVEFLQGSWFEPLAGRRFDLIVSNPPYVCEEDRHLQQGDVRYEPRTALSAGADGLDDIRRIVAAAPEHLHPGGWLLLEHGYDQGHAVRALLNDRGYTGLETFCDLAGKERVTIGQWSGSADD